MKTHDLSQLNLNYFMQCYWGFYGLFAFQNLSAGLTKVFGHHWPLRPALLCLPEKPELPQRWQLWATKHTYPDTWKYFSSQWKWNQLSSIAAKSTWKWEAQRHVQNACYRYSFYFKEFKAVLGSLARVQFSRLPAGSPEGGWAARVCTAAARSGSEPAAGRTASGKQRLRWAEWPISWAGSHRQTPAQATAKGKQVYAFVKTFSLLEQIPSFTSSFMKRFYTSR